MNFKLFFLLCSFVCCSQKQLIIKGKDSCFVSEYLIKTTNKSNIRFINLENNNLNSIPEELRLFHNLSSLRLSNNNISAKELYKIKSFMKLKWLFIDHNHLESLPNFLFEEMNLKYLYAHDNFIDSLKIQSPLKTSLWVLHMGNNNVQKLSSSFNNLLGLRFLILNSNKISTIDNCFLNDKPNFMGIVLDNNHLNKNDVFFLKMKFNHLMMCSIKNNTFK